MSSEIVEKLVDFALGAIATLGMIWGGIATLVACKYIDRVEELEAAGRLETEEATGDEA